MRKFERGMLIDLPTFNLSGRIIAILRYQRKWFYWIKREKQWRSEDLIKGKDEE